MRYTAKILFAGGFIGLLGVYACGSDRRPNGISDVVPDGSVVENLDGTVFETGASEGGVTEAGDVDSGLPLSCSDTIKDKDETDVDCGGSCAPCIDGKACTTNIDCAGSFCDPSTKKCKTATCNDGLKNGKETGTDCGGGTCQKCAVGGGCAVNTDCLANKCDATKVCGCPDRMIGVGNGGPNPFCIDQEEVSSADYDSFLKANQLITQQEPLCLPPVNNSYIPGGAWPPPAPLTASYGYPVRYVDWCDANAYCQWAGKVMCGKIKGGSLDITADAGVADPKIDAWYSACSGGGANKYPYGNAFNIDLCNGGTLSDASPSVGPIAVGTFGADGKFSNIDPTAESCQGTETNLFNMSGNVAEWEDSCIAESDAGVGDCLIRGGSFDSVNGQAALACTAAEQVVRTTQREDIGIRCCQF